jgi:hypothetical protein
MENITFFVERYGVIAVFLNVLLDEGGLPLPSYPLLAIAGALSVDPLTLLPSNGAFHGIFPFGATRLRTVIPCALRRARDDGQGLR